MSNNLCANCLYYYKGKYGLNTYIRPDQHCHHEKSEPKPCNWCDGWKTFNKIYRRERDGNSAMSYLVRQAFDLITRGEYLQECPMCHEKLLV
jgi:hypothetical protein